MAIKVVVGSKENVYTLPHYASEATAQRAALAKWQALQRMTATLTLSLPYGQADTIPQQPVTVQGIKNAIDAAAWAVKQINHDLSVAGFTSNIDLECTEVGKHQCLIE